MTAYRSDQEARRQRVEALEHELAVLREIEGDDAVVAPAPVYVPRLRNPPWMWITFWLGLAFSVMGGIASGDGAESDGCGVAIAGVAAMLFAMLCMLTQRPRHA